MSPFGRTADELWAGLSGGRSAVAAIAGFDTSGLEVRIGGEVREYAPREDMDPEAAATMDRRALFAADAAIQALIQAAVPITNETVSQLSIELSRCS